MWVVGAGVLSQWPFCTEWLHTVGTPWSDILCICKVTAIFGWGIGKRFLSCFWVKNSSWYSIEFRNIYAYRKTQGIQMKTMKRKRWRRRREKIPRRKRTQVLLQSEYHDKMAVLYVLLPLCIPFNFKTWQAFWCQELNSDFNVYVRWPLVPKFVGSDPAEAVGFLGANKNPQHAFLQTGSKAVSPMS